MRTSFISTSMLLNTPRAGVQRMQTEMMRLSKEIVTGRMADVGLNFGAATGTNVTLHVDLDSLSAVLNSTGSATTRLAHTQAALEQMRQNAGGLLDDILSAMQSPASAGTIQQTARSGLDAFVANANASDGHNYLLGGINSAVPPMTDYDAGSGAALDAAFLAKFGFAQGDPAAASISATDMADFLDNEFANLFADPAWGTTWSSASDQPLVTRVSLSETIDSSVSANQPAMRKLAMVYTMVAGLGIDKLSEDTRQLVLTRASGLAGQAVSDLVDVQAEVGGNQSRLKDATDRLTIEQQITQQHLSTLEGVDPAEAKVHFDALSTEIEMSYSLTARLLQMSLLNYA
jgi:flagellar hook-associated protein 3 FlgL